MSDFYILDGKTPKLVGRDEWATWMALSDRRVAVTDIDRDVSVSTVFLTLDHSFREEGPPVLFETMIFGGPHDQYCERYETWEQAEAGHAKAVAMATIPPTGRQEGE